MSTIDLKQLHGLSLLDVAPPEPTGGSWRSGGSGSFDDFLFRARTSSSDVNNNGPEFSEKNSGIPSPPQVDDSHSPQPCSQPQHNREDNPNNSTANNRDGETIDTATQAERTSDQQTGSETEQMKTDQASAQAKKEDEDADKGKVKHDNQESSNVDKNEEKVEDGLIDPVAVGNQIQPKLTEDAQDKKTETKETSDAFQAAANVRKSAVKEETQSLTPDTPQTSDAAQLDTADSATAKAKLSKNGKQEEILPAVAQMTTKTSDTEKIDASLENISKDSIGSARDTRNKSLNQKDKKETSASHVAEASASTVVVQDASPSAQSVNSTSIQAVVNAPIIPAKQAEIKTDGQAGGTVSKSNADIAVNDTLRVGSSATKAAASAQPGGPNETGTQFDRVRFVQRVEQAFAAIGDRGGSLRMKLSPPELGTIKLEISVRKGVMKAKVEADTPEAKNLLLENLPALRDRLARQDIKIQQFDVNLRDPASGGMSQQTANQSDSGAGNRGHRNPQVQGPDKNGTSAPISNGALLKITLAN